MIFTRLTLVGFGLHQSPVFQKLAEIGRHTGRKLGTEGAAARMGSRRRGPGGSRAENGEMDAGDWTAARLR